MVNDDFGDVYGIFFALYGAEYSFDELWEIVTDFAELRYRSI